jgi:hypothetical protein
MGYARQPGNVFDGDAQEASPRLSNAPPVLPAPRSFNGYLVAIEFILHVVRKSFSPAEFLHRPALTLRKPILQKLLWSRAGFLPN